MFKNFWIKIYSYGRFNVYEFESRIILQSDANFA